MKYENEELYLVLGNYSCNNNLYIGINTKEGEMFSDLTSDSDEEEEDATEDLVATITETNAFFTDSVKLTLDDEEDEEDDEKASPVLKFIMFLLIFVILGLVVYLIFMWDTFVFHFYYVINYEIY